VPYTRLHNKHEIKRYLERDLYLHIYGLGDLDDFFWPYTTWYGSESNGDLDAVVLVYAGPQLPTVVALTADPEATTQLLDSVGPVLPDRFYAHLSPGLETTLRLAFDVEAGAAHHKMALRESAPVLAVNTSSVVRLGVDDLPSLKLLYDESYPGNWFDPRMLETKQYFGIRDGDRLVSAAGVHVYSPRFRVAALGNIVTRPEFRNNGYGTQVTSALCKSLLADNLRIGLNVQADNNAAIACYRHLGFEIAAPYAEFVVKRKETA
jgi:GNAT superfamily N-acetyltransferase